MREVQGRNDSKLAEISFLFKKLEDLKVNDCRLKSVQKIERLVTQSGLKILVFKMNFSNI